MTYFELYNFDQAAMLDDFGSASEAFGQLREILEHDGAQAFQSLALVAIEGERRIVVARQDDLLNAVRPAPIAS
jgi:hypothetical protein